MVDYVFIGDSIIEWMNTKKFFPNLKICNLGIAGDTISGVIYRLEDAINESPEGILVMVGHNDLLMKGNFEATLIEYNVLCDKIKNTNISKVFITGLLPIDFISESIVINFNKGIEKAAQNFGFQFIEVYSHFVNKRGKAREDLSDGLHLTENGYVFLVDVIKNYIYI